ncbi:hypothetical protein AG1IA_00878 [Rhizoctonia solani AG-1 IA]|uniref:Uncharacterized protein n=1 Tax=Thanatephorus cucumeris (strain AG1-IA) TaxID=983506 RepID=L8X4F9_THACA|nr:hypothetical protein AG1IA_00878 [Rhizoctonia solani AG-1 IA]
MMGRCEVPPTWWIEHIERNRRILDKPGRKENGSPISGNMREWIKARGLEGRDLPAVQAHTVSAEA